MLIKLILATSLAIFVSAICSLFEAVLYSISTSRVEILAKSGTLSGRLLKNLKQDIRHPITAILTLNTIAHTVGAAIAGAAAAALFGDIYLSLFSAVFTFVILIFSEILPKTAGIIYNRQLAPMIALPLALLVKILMPVLWVCHFAARLIPDSNKENQIPAEELKVMALLSRKSGEIDSQQEGIIKNIINLRHKTVRQAMTPRTVTFTLNQKLSVSEARKLKAQWNRHSRVPVYEGKSGNIVGLVLRKDVLLSAAEGQKNRTLAALMRPINFVPETARLHTVMPEFFEKRQHLFCVVDEYGGMTGVISLEDILEEIMGREIIDETDPSKTMRDLARDKGKRMQDRGQMTDDR